MQIRTARQRLLAVLGPTNTGKTHLAMERMLGHSSGMIGFPLRLLARENYDRAVAKVGRSAVALITGEEKIVPQHARYFLCTVESMPVDRPVAFLGVDEIQMCADPDRGHIFTERLMYARGQEETMFMGSDTVRPLLQRLVPEAEFETRPRFSTLAYSGQKRINRLPARTAIVAFSVADVYAIAELTRRQRGGAAVVLGALSPRTRNAQVALYQAGEVDYLVATDAIGMGLNMDIDHVAFASLRKFDGRVLRDLTPAELAQIAGRAGRHMNHGTFGTTAEAGAIPDEAVNRIQNHTFDPLPAFSWRNTDLNFSSIDGLLASLNQRPPMPGLTRVREADDERTLNQLAKDPAIAGLAVHREAVRQLWEVCRIPDFRKTLSDDHARLLGRIYRYLMAPEGRLPVDWVADQVARIDRVEGDIETLTARIAHVRTWTYIAYRGDWLDDSAHWQARTRAVEDRLSDALHDRLTQRFVDRRTAALVGLLKDREALSAAVTASGEVLVEGHSVGRMSGFRFHADKSEGDTAAGRRVGNAALRALRGEIESRVRRFEAEEDSAFAFSPDGKILWRGEEVATLGPGRHPLHPAVRIQRADLLEGGHQERLRQRLTAWLEATIAQRMAAIFAAERATLAGPARGLVFQLGEALGSLPRSKAVDQIGALTQEDRKALRSLGIRLGRESLYLPALLKPGATALRAILWTAAQGRDVAPAPPPAGRMSVPVDPNLPAGFYEAVGYRVLGPRAVRLDIVERLAALAWTGETAGGFALAPEMMNLTGCSAAEMEQILEALGFRPRKQGEAMLFRHKRAQPQGKHSPRKGERKRHPPKREEPKATSPFAKLKALAFPS
jgi:ATP-dependent RNA helicase SUPV3L1/SUV3